MRTDTPRRLGAIGLRLTALRKGPIARGSLTSMLIRVVALGVGFAQAILAARLLGAEGYGIVSVAIAVATLAATLSVMGLGPLAVRELAKYLTRADWGRLRGFLRFALGAVLVASVLAGSVIAALALGTTLFDPAFRTAIALAGALVPLIALVLLFKGLAQGFGRVAAAQLPGEVLRTGVMVALLASFALAAHALGTLAYIGLAAIAAASAAVAGAIAVGRIVSSSVPAARPRREAQAWSRAAAPFLGIAVAIIVLEEVNTLMLGWLAGPAEAGLFQPVARLAPLMLIGTQAVMISYAPRVAALWTQSELAALAGITRLVTLATALTAVAVCGSIVLVGPRLLAAFGPEFGASLPALWWIAAAQVIGASCGPVAMLLTMTGHQNRALAGQLAALMVNFGLGWWLIPEHGALGAAQAMAAGIVTWNLTMLIGVRLALGFDPSVAGVLTSVAPRRG